MSGLFAAGKQPAHSFSLFIEPRRKTPGFRHGDTRRAARRRNMLDTYIL